MLVLCLYLLIDLSVKVGLPLLSLHVMLMTLDGPEVVLGDETLFSYRD